MSTLKRPRIVLLSLVLLPVTAAGQEPRVVYAELQDGVVASAELAGGPGVNETVEYSIFFLSARSQATVDIPRPGDKVVSSTVKRVALRDPGAAVRIERCHLVEGVPRCRRLETPPIERIPGSGLMVQLRIPPQRIDWDGEFLRLTIAEGRYALEIVDETEAVLESEVSPPVHERRLPTLADLERQFLEQRPFLHLDFTPFVRDQDGGAAFSELALSFEGGIFRASSRGNTFWEIHWEGDVATEDSLSFDRLAASAGLGFNLLPRDWLPLRLSAVAESDRDLDAVDASGQATASVIAPFNLRVQSGPYRPAVAPRLSFVAALGKSVDRVDPDSEMGFFRGGYEVRWRVPVRESTVVRIHHAGLWNDPFGADGRWHALWDIVVELDIAGMTYVIGYREGEAAPLFEPTETTRVGLSIAVGAPARGS